jgi:hypothetical protein
VVDFIPIEIFFKILRNNSSMLHLIYLIIQSCLSICNNLFINFGFNNCVVYQCRWKYFLLNFVVILKYSLFNLLISMNIFLSLKNYSTISF